MEKYMTREQMREYFGVSDDTIRKWEKEGLTYCDLGTRTRYYEDTDIINFMDGKKVCSYER